MWAAGLTGLLLMRRLRPWRPLGIAFVVVALWLTFQNAKPYYLLPAYPMIVAAGAVVITGWLGRFRRISRVTAIALPGLLAVEGLLIAPLAMPLLSPANTWPGNRPLACGRGTWSATKRACCRSTSPTGSGGRNWRGRSGR